MPRFYFSFEDDSSIWSVAEMDCPDDNAACECAVQLLAELFARMHDDAPDWSKCLIRVAARPGADILVSSAAQAALVERDLFRAEAVVRTDH
jgi:hypothetical protein